jgi:DNA-binding GntR family transcriptional regulator
VVRDGRKTESDTEEMATAEGPRPRILVSRAEQVKQELLQMLLDGAFAPGERVDQAAIADALGVSRTPLHEAFVALRADGLFSHDKHLGTFAPRIDERYLQDHLDLLGGVYAGLAFAATVRSDLAMLQRVAESSRALCDVNQGDDRSLQGPALLEELRRAGRSRVLCGRAHSLHLLVSENAVISALGSTATAPLVSGLADAVEARDGNRAGACWGELFHEASMLILGRLSR